MSHETETHAENHAHQHSPLPYALTLGALLVLTVITVFAAGINFGSSSINVVIALGIATIKASLVALVFMHLRNDKPINAVIAVAGFLFLGLMLMFTLIDINNREDLVPSALKEKKPAAAQMAAPPAAEAPKP